MPLLWNISSKKAGMRRGSRNRQPPASVDTGGCIGLRGSCVPTTLNERVRPLPHDLLRECSLVLVRRNEELLRGLTNMCRIDELNKVVPVDVDVHHYFPGVYLVG